MRFFSVSVRGRLLLFEPGGRPILVDTRCPLNSPSWSAITRPPHPTAAFLRERSQLLPRGGLGFADADVFQGWRRSNRLRLRAGTHIRSSLAHAARPSPPSPPSPPAAR